MAKEIQLSPEDEQLNTLLNSERSSPKFAKWGQLFLDKSNKQTYGNRTQSAIVAYELDPITQYSSAGTIGHENYNKLKHLGMMYIEQAGMTAGVQLDLLVSKAVNSPNAKFLQMLMEISGVYTPKPSIAIQNIQNNQVVQITKEEEMKLDKEFSDFINAKYSGDASNSDIVALSES